MKKSNKYKWREPDTTVYAQRKKTEGKEIDPFKGLVLSVLIIISMDEIIYVRDLRGRSYFKCPIN
jgi:hypothetical protein